MKIILTVIGVVLFILLIQYIRVRMAISNAKTTLPNGQCESLSKTLFPFSGWSPCKDDLGNVTVA